MAVFDLFNNDKPEDTIVLKVNCCPGSSLQTHNKCVIYLFIPSFTVIFNVDGLSVQIPTKPRM